MNNLIAASQEMTMSSFEIARLTEKQHKHVIRDVRAMIEELTIDGPVLGYVETKDSRGYTAGFQLNKELTETLITGYSTRLRRNVIKRLNELEGKNKASLLSLPNFNDPIAAAEAWIEAKKSEQLAIATKAEIGNRREATAMNTASQAVKRANKLEIELDQSQEWSTIKRMEIITGLSFNWRLLKSAGADLGIDSKDVFDPNFGTVKAYHADVWREAYALDIKQ